jgi:antitoxin YqcF
MTNASFENKAIANKIATAVGGAPSVTRFWDDGKKKHIDLLLLADRPTRGVTTVASLGLSDIPLYFKDKEYPTRIEILGCFQSQEDLFPNIISTASFNIIKDNWFCAPGIIYPDIVSMYYPDYSMKHLYFTTPFLWENSLVTIDMPSKKVSFLLGIPISEKERNYVVEYGSVELEAIFERENINIFNLRRESTL